MVEDKVTIGNKEYTREELLEFGKRHYPKFYWITRGAGIGLMFIGILTALIFVTTLFGVYGFMPPMDGEQSDSSWFAYYAVTIPSAFIALVGIVLFGISFIKKPDEAYIKHAVDYYTKLDANRRAREARNKVSEEKPANQKDVSQLLKYKELLDAGIITQEEFDIKKKELLE